MLIIVAIKGKVGRENDSLVVPCKLALFYPQHGVAFSLNFQGIRDNYHARHTCDSEELIKKAVYVTRPMNINTFHNKEPLAPYWLPNKTVALL